mgnify:CR=1 FL=1
MSEDVLLLTPGPVPLSTRVRRAMDRPMVSHRSADFEAVFERGQSGLDYVFTRSTLDETRTATDGTTLVLNGTATMAMEAAVANLVDADDEVVALVNGKFGRRFARIADRHATCTTVEVDWGQSFDLEAVDAAISDETALVTMVHNETSTGLLNPVAEVGELVAAHDAHFVVDGVTSIGGDEFRIADWHVDVAITDAQKAIAAPPGISALYATERAIDAFDGETAPFYEDLDWHVRKAADHQTPFTSAVPLFRALAEAVEQIVEEGTPHRIRRHRRQAQAFGDGLTAMGLERFPDLAGPTDLSNTVTAMALPDAARADPEAFFDAVAERKVAISGGQAHLAGHVFRVSNMGNLRDDQVMRGLEAVGGALREVGVKVDVDAGVNTARDVLNKE